MRTASALVTCALLACGSSSEPERASVAAPPPPAVPEAPRLDPRLAPGHHTLTLRLAGLALEVGYDVAGSGPPCIGLAGGPGFSSGYYHGSPLERHLRMIYVDLVGTGASQRLPGNEPYSIELDVDTVEAVRDALGLARVCLIGHSYGGTVAQRYAMAHSPKLSGLVLYTTTPTMGQAWIAEVTQNRTWFAKEPWFADAMNGVAAQTQAQTQAEAEAAFWLQVPFYFADWTHHGERYKPHLARSKYTLEVFRRRSWDPPFEARDRLGEIVAPTLVIAGERDFVCGPGPSGELARGIRGATLVTIAGAGHFPHLEAPEAFERAIADFIPAITRGGS